MPTLANDGDWIEHHNAGWIALNLSQYELIWAEFIGNSGENAPSPSRILRSEYAEKYALFTQHHYSLAVAVIRMRDIGDRLEQRTLQRVGTKVTPDHYLDDVDQYFMFMAYLGNAVDQLLKMDEILKANLGTQGKLQTFLEFRHTVIHGPRVPIKTDDFEVHVPTLAGTNARPGEWQAKVVWGSVPDDRFISLTTYCRDVLVSFLASANTLLGGLRGELPKWFLPVSPSLPASTPEPVRQFKQPSKTEESWVNRGLSGQALLPRNPADESRE